MASKYLQKYPVPEDFPDLLHDFAREVLRDQPADIYHFGAEYFTAMYTVSYLSLIFTRFILVLFCNCDFNRCYRAMNSIILRKVLLFHHPRRECQILPTTMRLSHQQTPTKSKMLQKAKISNTIWMISNMLLQ